MIVCSRCHESKPADAFGISRSRSTGRQGYCKPCNSASARAWAKENPERSREIGVASAERHKEERAAYSRGYAKAHPEWARAKKRAYYARNKERLNAERLQRHHDNIEQSRARQREWAHAHPLQCADNRARRRARLHGQSAGPVDYRAIVERDGWICYLCGESIIEGDHHFDHVIPLAKGGLHATENIRTTHATCNRRKHLRIPEGLCV